MRNNEYTATPNWFKQESTDSLAGVYQTNYYLTGSTSSGSGISSINLYNKYIINTYRLTVDDLFIPNTAIIAVDSELPEGLEPPEDFVSEVGNNVEATNWHTSYLISVVSGTNLIANLKANSNRYGIVFYDEYNQPISGYTPTVDELATIPVPENARYFRCCHYIEPVVESVEEPVEPTYEFYIEYTGMGNYEDSDLNTAYSGIFENFTNINSSVPEGINTKLLSTSGLNLIFLQPLSCTVDKSNNIKIGLDKVFTDSKVLDLWTLIEDEQGNKYIITDYNVVGKGGITAYYNDDLNPGGDGGLGGGGSIVNIQIIGEGNVLSDVTLSEDKSLLTFTKSEIEELNLWKLIEDEQGNKYIVTDYNIVGRGGITAYYDGDLTPGSGGGLGGGTILDIEIKGEGNALVNVYLNEDKSILNFDRGYLMDLTTEQTSTALKTFTEGIKIGDTLIKVIDGVLTLDCSLAVTGGITAYALGEQTASSIMDAIICDNTTITVVDGKLTVIGGTGGASNWDELEGKPSWITDTKPTYAWGEITQKPTTLSGYGITDAYTKTELNTIFDLRKVYSINLSSYSYSNFYPVIFNREYKELNCWIHSPSFPGSASYNCNRIHFLISTSGWNDFATSLTILSRSNFDDNEITIGSIGRGTVGGGCIAVWLRGGFNYTVICNRTPTLKTGNYTISNETYTIGTGLSGGTNVNVEILWTNDGNRTKYDLATKSSNVASATKLQTARTIWGQSFDGTANVTGSLTSVIDITGTGTFTGANIKATDSVYVNGIRLHKTVDGAVTIEGNLLVTGGITAYADGEDSGGTGVIVIDNLTSTLTDAALSANQGRVLKDLIDSKVSNWGELEGKPTTIAGYGIQASDVLNVLKTVDGSGSGMDADLLDGLDWNSFDLQRTYTINLNSYSSSNFYPVIFNQEYRELNCWINSPSKASSAAYNCNRIHFLYTTTGWSDFGNTLTILSRHNHDDGEITIGSIGRGTKGGGCIAVWLRGGLSYAFRCNRTPNLKTSNYTIGEETYTVGTGISGGTNSNVDIIWTNDSNRTKYDLAAISSNVASATNADKLDGVHLNGIFTAFTTNGNNTRLTIGGVTKDLTVPYASNADKLDGIQLANIVYYANTNSYDNTICSRIIPISGVNLTDGAKCGSIFQWTNTTTRTPAQTGENINWFNQLFGATNNRIYFRTRTNGGGWTPWNKLAYITDNVASATKLQTARTIWGQSFDGTANVSGSLTGVTNITASGAATFASATINGALTVPYSEGQWISMATRSEVIQANQNQRQSSAHALFRVKSYSGNAVCFGGLGNEVGFYGFYKSRIDSGSNGTDWYTKWNTSDGTLTHKGNLLVTGGGTFYSSDIRAKTIIERPKLSLNSIANSPVIKFRWNGYSDLKDDGKLHIGGVAQYIEKILPECVVGQKDDFLSFDYATVGYIFSVQTARHLQSYETKTDREIKKLKNRITFLEKQLKKLGYEEVDIVAD